VRLKGKDKKYSDVEGLNEASLMERCLSVLSNREVTMGGPLLMKMFVLPKF